jgi:hypothetical protein
MEAYEAAKERDRAALAAPTVQEPVCQKCGGTGEVEEGGVYPSGDLAYVPCECATPPAAPVSLNRDGIQKLLEQSGFDKATPEERAAFISGIRHRESEILDTPPAAPVPLTDEQKLMCWSRATHDADVEHKTEHQCLMDYGSEIEAAHGITKGNTP